MHRIKLATLVACWGIGVFAGGCSSSHVDVRCELDGGVMLDAVVQEDAFVQADAAATQDASVIDGSARLEQQIWMTTQNHDMTVRNLQTLRIADALHVALIVELHWASDETATQVIYARGPANDASISAGGRGWAFDVLETRFREDIRATTCSLAVSGNRAYVLYALRSALNVSELTLVTATSGIDSPLVGSVPMPLEWTESDFDTSQFTIDEAHVAANEGVVGVVFQAYARAGGGNACRAGILATTGPAEWQAFPCAHVGPALMDTDVATSAPRLRFPVSTLENDKIQVASLILGGQVSTELLRSWSGTDSVHSLRGFFAKGDAVALVYKTDVAGDAALFRLSDRTTTETRLLNNFAISHPQSDAMYLFDFQSLEDRTDLHMFDGVQHRVHEVRLGDYGSSFGVDTETRRISFLDTGDFNDPITLSEGPLP